MIMFKQALVAILIGGLCGYFALKGVHWQDVGAALSDVNPIPFLLTIPLMIFGHLMRTWRWQVVLKSIKAVPFWPVFGINCVGFMMVNFLPFRLGELTRPLLLCRRESIPYPAALASSAVERIFDGVMVLVVLVTGLLLAPTEIDTIPIVGMKMSYLVYGSVGLFGPLLLGVFILIFLQRRALSVVRTVTGFLPDRIRLLICDGAERFVEGLTSLKHSRDLVSIVFTSALLWLSILASYYLMLSAFEIDLTWPAIGLVLGITCLGIMLPGPPGFVGTYELFCKAALALFAIEGSQAVSFAIASHVFNLGFMLVAGLIFLPFHPFSLRDISNQESLNSSETHPEQADPGETATT